MQRWLKNLIWSFILILIFYAGSAIQTELQEYQNIYYRVMPNLVFSVLFPIFVGIMLRLPKLVTEIQEKKRWLIDWVKLIFIGIPTLFIAIGPFATWYFVPLFLKEFWYVGSTPTIMAIAGVIFGYLLLDSLKEK